MTSNDDYEIKKNELIKKLNEALDKNSESQVIKAQKELSRLGIGGSLREAAKNNKSNE
jgi:hypothetical protein